MTAARFWDWVDDRGVVRRGVLGVTLYLTWHSYHWASAFAVDSSRSGADIAMIIAAVLAPITVLQGHAFRAYIDSRSDK